MPQVGRVPFLGWSVFWFDQSNNCASSILYGMVARCIGFWVDWPGGSGRLGRIPGTKGTIAASRVASYSVLSVLCKRKYP